MESEVEFDLIGRPGPTHDVPPVVPRSHQGGLLVGWRNKNLVITRCTSKLDYLSGLILAGSGMGFTFQKVRSLSLVCERKIPNVISLKVSLSGEISRQALLTPFMTSLPCDHPNLPSETPKSPCQSYDAKKHDNDTQDSVYLTGSHVLLFLPSVLFPDILRQTGKLVGEP